MRYHLYRVLLLAVITVVLSLVAIIAVINEATAQRVERAGIYVSEEVDRLAKVRGDLTPVLKDQVEVVGMLGGRVPSAAAVPSDRIEPRWRDTLAATLAESARSGELRVMNAPLPHRHTLVVAARPAIDGGLAWALFVVRPFRSLTVWRWVVGALSFVTLLLVLASVHALISARAGITSLQGALQSLAHDLKTPVPRPALRELRIIADGIADLANHLEESNRGREKLSADLARQERLAALGRVVAGVAHEVRNPLAAIKLRLDLATSGSEPLPPRVTEAINKASAEIARLDRLVADLLIVSAKRPSVVRRTPLGSLLRTRADALAPWAEQRHVGVVVTGDADVDIDADSVARALDNLLRNAVEASQPGQQVTAEVRADSEAVHASVIDQGPGVSAPRAAELFEPFFSTKAGGTGLGLAVSRAIARAHGGELTYDRQDGKTRFELVLPHSRASRERRPA